jgi:hypothetical protein
VQYAQITEENVTITPASGEAVVRGPGVTINGK